ncbi:MAG: DUF3857 domain-containing protein, partial [Pseudomonadota bacterium]
MRIHLKFRLAVTGLFLWLSAGWAVSQDVADYIQVTDVPDWVVPVSIPDFDVESYQDREVVWPLTDYQKRLDQTREEMTYRYVVDLLSAAGIEENGTISISFDPSYEVLELHDVSIIRDGQTIDAIDFTEAMVFRTETDRDQMIFNGRLTFSMPILDLRVGDRLSVQYSRKGRNTALGEGFLVRRAFATNYELKRRFIRILIDEDIQIHTKTINDPPEPAISVSDGWRVHQWDAPDPQEADRDDDAPPWAYLHPTYEISNFESWAEVGNSFQGYYDIDQSARDAVASIVAEIAAEHDTPRARTRAALDWVQTNIRYVGLELGESGFIPRQPSRVLLRRFGDCKDVTLLLLTLLDELGVKADPLLVHMEERGGEFQGLPHPYAFDHIKVLAEIDGTLYPLDATRDPQIGTLDTMEKGDIEYGLRLIDGASTVTELPRSDYDYREVVSETFDLVSDPSAILYTLVFEEYGADADATLAWIASDGVDAVEDTFDRYLRDIYPTLETADQMTWMVDEERAMTRLNFSYRLPGYGTGEREELSTRAFQILAAMPAFEGGKREAPFAIDHPERVRQIRHYIGDDNYRFVAQNQTYDTYGFRFEKRDEVQGNTLIEDYRWISKQDHIPSQSFEADMVSIDEIIDWNYTRIDLAVEADVEVVEETPDVVNWLSWLFFIGLPALLIGLGIRSRR